MPLDPDAEAFLRARAEAGPSLPLSVLGASKVREVMAAATASAPSPRPIQHVLDHQVPGPVGAIPIRVYRPSDADALPVVVYLHGGGWTFGSLDAVDALCRELSVQVECVVVSVDYRLAPEHKFPVPLDDAYAALRWVAAHGDLLGAEADRLAVAGDSAGANLAVAAALRARDDAVGPPISALVLAYPVTEYAVARPSWVDNGNGPVLTADDVEWLWDQYLRDESDRSDPRAVPSLAHSLSGLPPTFVLSAEYDLLRDDGEHFAQSLADAGVPTEVERYLGAFHGFFTMVTTLRRAEEAVADAADFLRRRLGATPGLSKGS